MKVLYPLILALVALTPAQIVYDGGRTSLVDTVRWGDADDSTHSLLLRKTSKFRDSAGTWRALSGIDSCSKAIPISNGTVFPKQKLELSYEVRTSSGNTDSSQAKLKIDSRYCWGGRDTTKCDSWVSSGRYHGDTASIVMDSLYTLATSSGTTWKPSRNLFDVPGGTHIRFCVDGSATGAQTNDSTFFRRLVVRVSAVASGGTPPSNVTVSGGTIATSTKQSDGSQKTQIVDGSGNVIGATSNALDVNIKSGASSGAVAQGSTTSGQTGGLTQAAVTTAAPSYTTAQTSPLSINTAGGLRVDPSGVTSPVSLASVPSHAVTNAGTFAVQAAESGTWNVNCRDSSGLQMQSVSQYAEDVAHASGDYMMMAGAVRRDTPASSSGTDGDNSTINTDASGRVWVNSGQAAHGASVTGNPNTIGAEGRTSDRTAVSNAQVARLMSDVFGKLVVLPGCLPENVVKGRVNLTDSTAATVISAAGSGVKVAIYSYRVTNAHATVGTKVEIRDGTTIWDRPFAAANGGGAAPNGGGIPMAIGTANTAVTARAVTTGSDVEVSITGCLMQN